jgi:tetratricopeptide (TPR) repeat protein
MRPDLAIPLLERAIDVLRAEDDGLALAECYESLGVANRGSADHGIACYRRAIELYREAGAESALAQLLYSMAYRSLIPAGELDDARDALHQCLTISIGLGSRHTAAHAMAGFGQLARLAGDGPAARRILSVALREFRVIADRRCIGRMLTALARIAMSEGDVKEAGRLLREAITVAIDVDVPTSEEVAETVDVLALMEIRTGRFETAARWLGAVEHVRAGASLLRPPPDQRAIDLGTREVEAALGRSRAAELLAAGAETTLDEVAREAGAPLPAR